jgi:competence protein ComEA
MKRMKTLVAVGLLCSAIAATAVAAGNAPARVDVNAASAAELEQLPGIGPSLARAIVEHRTHAPFKRPEDLRDVKGVGDRLYERLKDQITVGDAGAAPRGRGQ